MHLLKIHDLEANVLDQQEHKEAVTIIGEEINSRYRQYDGYTLNTSLGSQTFTSIIYGADALGKEYNDIPADERENVFFAYSKWLHQIEPQCSPDFFHLFHVNAKTLIMHAIEGNVVLDNGDYDIEQKQKVIQKQIAFYERAEKEMEKAIAAFDKFSKDKNPNVLGWKTVMLNELAYIDLSRADSVVFANNCGANVTERKVSIDYAKKCTVRCFDIFKKEKFLDEKTAVYCARNLALALRHLPSSEHIDMAIGYVHALKKHLPGDKQLKNLLEIMNSQNRTEADEVAKEFMYYSSPLHN